MLLTIDAGNSNVCFALFDRVTLWQFWRLETHGAEAAQFWNDHLNTVLDQHHKNRDDIHAIILCCVVSHRLTALKDFCAQFNKVQVWVMGEAPLTLPSQALIPNPAEVGLDLMANAWGAHCLFDGPLLVVDLGTAITLSVVDAQGHFRGTVIVPGINTAAQALHQATGALPAVSLEDVTYVVGTDTLSSLQSGLFWGYVSLLEGLIQRILIENFQGLFTKNYTVVATGGLSPLIASHVPSVNATDPFLTVKGLAYIVDNFVRRTL